MMYDRDDYVFFWKPNEVQYVLTCLPIRREALNIHVFKWMGITMVPLAVYLEAHHRIQRRKREYS